MKTTRTVLAAGLMACGMSLQLSAGEAGFLSVRDFGAKGDEGE